MKFHEIQQNRYHIVVSVKVKDWAKLLKHLLWIFRTLEFLVRLGFISRVNYRSKEFEYIDSIKNDNLKLNVLFQQYGSDKSNPHDYHKIYEPILVPLINFPCNILEVGIGTSNELIPSNMSHGNFSPGASLRALSAYLPKANVFGADVDPSVLFETSTIRTCFVDQTKPKTFRSLNNLLGEKVFNLIIVDGLHHPYADLVSLVKLLPRINKGGYLIIEDIRKKGPHHRFWRIALKFIYKRNYETTICEMKVADLIRIQRKS